MKILQKLAYANGNMPLTDEEKQEIIKEAAKHYGRYMDAMRIDWRKDPNSEDTPMRVAKAFVNDLAEGCYNEEPKITAFDNLDKYDGMVFQGNIKVNSLSPGFVDTKLTRKNNDNQKIKEWENKIPLNRLANPNDIAEVAYFLCNDNKYITGQDIVVDGGYTIGGFEVD